MIPGQGAVALREAFKGFLAGFLVVLELLRAVGELAGAFGAAQSDGV